MFESEIVGHKNAPDGYLYSWVAAGALALQGFEIFKYVQQVIQGLYY